MNIVQLGKTIEGDERRDAIHLAIVPVVADCKLGPGQDIGFSCKDKTDRVGIVSSPIGIVDPFLNTNVLKGETFWMVLYPGTITSLRHEWTHPAFKEVENLSKEEATEWFSGLAKYASMTLQELIEKVENYRVSGEVYTEIGREGLRDAFYEDPVRFWRRYEVMTGTKRVTTDDSPFSCSC